MNNSLNFLNLGLIDYVDYLKQLDELTKNVLEDPSQVYFLTCSHPPVYTYGSGLEKSKGKVLDNLNDFDIDHSSTLPYNFFKIKRGGGLTFHYPEQLIMYPIFHLTHHRKNLQVFMMRFLKMASDSLNEVYSVDHFHYKGQSLGLWHKEKKVGSIGMGLNRYVTQHGIALNNYTFSSESNSKLSLCGIQKNTYSSINEVLNKEVSKEILAKKIKDKFQEFFT